MFKGNDDYRHAMTILRVAFECGIRKKRDVEQLLLRAIRLNESMAPAERERFARDVDLIL